MNHLSVQEVLGWGIDMPGKQRAQECHIYTITPDNKGTLRAPLCDR